MLATKIEQKKNEEGFTLIELLVVVIIIGILAAIAIPAFLNQREAAWQRAAESDLRNAAIEMETYYTNLADYPTTVSVDDAANDAAAGEVYVQLSDNVAPVGTTTEPTAGDAAMTVDDNGEAYCLSVTHLSIDDAGGIVAAYDSGAGGLVAREDVGTWTCSSN